jgi:hypothetical protein
MALEDQMNEMITEPSVDPVSGNEIPLGSTAEEVRDDIDARLSEGEYVVPADVLRFYGVKFFEDLRDKAKSEYAEMAEEGRIGGEPVSEEGPEDVEISDEDMMEGISDEDMADIKAVMEGTASLPMDASDEDMAEVQSVMEGEATTTMAQGGITSMPKASQMNVREDVDGMIDRMYEMVKNNPEVKRKLDAKGIKMAEGGYVKGYAGGGLEDGSEPDFLSGSNTGSEPDFLSGSNTGPVPSFLSGMGALGFSQTLGATQGYSGPRATELVDYYNPSTGATMQISVYSDTKQPVTPVPQGFQLGKPQAPSRRDSDDDDDDKPPAPRWYDGIEFGNSESVSEWAKTQKGPPSLLRASAIGAAGTVSTVANLRAAAILEKAKNGGKDNSTSTALNEQANTMQETYSPFEKFLSKMFGDSGEVQAKFASSQVGINLADPTKNTIEPTPERDDKGGGSPEKDDKTDPKKTNSSNDGGPSAAQIAAQNAAADAKEKTKNVASYNPASSSGIGPSPAGGTTAGGADLDAAMNISGLNKGGLMKKRK